MVEYQLLHIQNEREILDNYSFWIHHGIWERWWLIQLVEIVIDWNTLGVVGWFGMSECHCSRWRNDEKFHGGRKNGWNVLFVDIENEFWMEIGYVGKVFNSNGFHLGVVLSMKDPWGEEIEEGELNLCLFWSVWRLPVGTTGHPLVW